MNVSLTPDLEKLVQEKVDSGMYNSASEVVREALRLMAESDKLRAAKIEALQEAINLGTRQLDGGDFEEYDGRSAKTLLKKIRSREK